MNQPIRNYAGILITFGVVGGFILLIWLARLWIRAGATGDPGEDYAKRSRRASWIGPAAPAGISLMFLVAGLTAKGIDADMLPVFWGLTAIFGGLALAIHWYYRREARLGIRKAKMKPPASPPASPWLWVFVILTVAGTIWFLNPAPRRPGPPQPDAGREIANPPVQAPPVVRWFLVVSAWSAAFPFVAIGVTYAKAKFRRKNSIVPSFADHKRKMRFRGLLWPAWVLLIGGRFALAGSYNYAGFLYAAPDRSTYAAYPVFLITAGLIHWWYRLRARVDPSFTQIQAAVPRDPSQPNPPMSIGAKATLTAFIGVMILMIYLWFPHQGPRGELPRRPLPSGWACILTFAALVAASAFGWAIRFQRVYDRGVRRAKRRALEGDVEGAIGELQHEIEMRGPSVNRLFGLTELLIKERDYASAAGWLRKALAIEPKNNLLLTNLAYCLFEMDDPDEADRVFSAMGVAGHADPGHLVNLARSLVFLERLDTAEKVIQRAEQNMAITPFDDPEKARALEVEIATTRAKIAEARGIPKADLTDS